MGIISKIVMFKQDASTSRVTKTLENTTAAFSTSFSFSTSNDTLDLSLKYNPKGLLPEVPYRPERPIVAQQDSGKTEIAAIPSYDEFSEEEADQNE